MKNWQIGLVVVALVALFGGPPAARALSMPIAQLKNCDNITVSSTAVSSEACMGGWGSNISVQNESTTCIRVGGSGVTTTTGFSVGVGCASGAAISIDAKRLWLISSGADVTGVDIMWGAQ